MRKRVSDTRLGGEIRMINLNRELIGLREGKKSLLVQSSWKADELHRADAPGLHLLLVEFRRYSAIAELHPQVTFQTAEAAQSGVALPGSGNSISRVAESSAGAAISSL